MGQGKKKHKKHQSFHKAFKPFIHDSRVLYAILGGFGAGVGLAAIIGPEKGEELINKLTVALKEWEQHNTLTHPKSKTPKLPEATKPDKPPKTKKPKKPKKLFSTRVE